MVSVECFVEKCFQVIYITLKHNSSVCLVLNHPCGLLLMVKTGGEIQRSWIRIRVMYTIYENVVYRI